MNAKQKPNFLVVDKETPVSDIEEMFNTLVKRNDIAVVLINQHVSFLYHGVQSRMRWLGFCTAVYFDIPVLFSGFCVCVCVCVYMCVFSHL